MSQLLKRELFFWLIAAVAITGYVALGRQLAPEIPPNPAKSKSQTKKLKSMQELSAVLAADRKAQNIYDNAVRDRQEFVQRWYQYGAFAGIVLVMIYTWLRPPWRGVEPSDEKSPGRAKNVKKETQSA